MQVVVAVQTALLGDKGRQRGFVQAVASHNTWIQFQGLKRRQEHHQVAVSKEHHY